MRRIKSIMDIGVKIKEIDVVLEDVIHLENMIGVITSSIKHINNIESIDIKSEINRNTNFLATIKRMEDL